MIAATAANAVANTAYTNGLAATNATGGAGFGQILASANGGESLSRHVFRNGQISVDMHADGKRINGVSYYDATGQKLNTSGFWPQDILRNCEKFSIPLSDLQAIGPQLDAAGVGYRPFEQYAGTGSNHGIDLDNLASGGMGTAYDWTQDPLVHLKGPSARAQLAGDQALAQRLGLTPWACPSLNASAATQLASSATTAAQAAAAATTTANAPAPATTLSALDELLQLIKQVKTSLQNTSIGQPTMLTPAASPHPTALPATTPVQANENTAAAPATTAQDPTTTQRLSQMKSLLEQLLAQR